VAVKWLNNKGRNLDPAGISACPALFNVIQKCELPNGAVR